MGLISKGRITPCNNKIGGIKNVYIYNFSYSWGAFDVIINDCELLKVPDNTVLYKYEAVESSFTETDKIEDDGVSFEQSLSVTLTGYDYELMLLPNKLISVVIEMYDGTFRAVGVKNGLSTKISFESGGAITDLNGMKLDFDGLELDKAPYIYDLASVGFVIDGAVIEDNFVFQDNNNFVFQDDNNFIFQ